MGTAALTSQDPRRVDELRARSGDLLGRVASTHDIARALGKSPRWARYLQEGHPSSPAARVFVFVDALTRIPGARPEILVQGLLELIEERRCMDWPAERVSQELVVGLRHELEAQAVEDRASYGLLEALLVGSPNQLRRALAFYTDAQTEEVGVESRNLALVRVLGRRVA